MPLDPMTRCSRRVREIIIVVLNLVVMVRKITLVSAQCYLQLRG